MGIGERLRGLFRAPGADLIPPPEGWWRELGDEVLEYLHEEGRTRGREVLAEVERQERKVAVFLAWMLALISASGLFGDLQVGTDGLGAASWAALALTGVAIAAATYVFWPRDWDLGPNLRQLADHSDDPREMRGLAVDTLVTAYCLNMNLVVERARAVNLMTGLVPLQAVAVVAVQVLAG